MTANTENQANLPAAKATGVASFIVGVACAILVLALIATAVVLIATASVLGLILNIGIVVVFAALVLVGLWLFAQ
jgi:hypothetical protein